MDSNMKSQDKEIDEDVQELIKDFDMNEYGNVAENGWYLIKRVISLKKRWQDEAAIMARLQMSANTFTKFKLQMLKQDLSARPPKGTRFRTPLEELVSILEEEAPLNSINQLKGNK